MRFYSVVKFFPKTIIVYDNTSQYVSQLLKLVNAYKLFDGLTNMNNEQLIFAAFNV